MAVVETDTVAPDPDLLDPGTVDGDHPDPATLTEPEHDDQGLLRWGSAPRRTDD